MCVIWLIRERKSVCVRGMIDQRERLCLCVCGMVDQRVCACVFQFDHRERECVCGFVCVHLWDQCEGENLLACVCME